MSWHSCKVISLFAGSSEESHWVLHPPPLPRRPELTVLWWCVETKERVWQTRLLCQGSSSFLQQPHPPAQVRVEEYLKRLWYSLHMKWNIKLPTARQQRNAWSLFLSTCTPTHAQTALHKPSVHVWDISLGIVRTLEELPPPHSSALDRQQFTVEILLSPRMSLSQTSHWSPFYTSLKYC